jgi:hypothetical protein
MIWVAFIREILSLTLTPISKNFDPRWIDDSIGELACGTFSTVIKWQSGEFMEKPRRFILSNE